MVVATGSISMRGRQSGLDLEQPASWVVELRDGRLLRLRNFVDPDEAAEVRWRASDERAADQPAARPLRAAVRDPEPDRRRAGGRRRRGRASCGSSGSRWSRTTRPGPARAGAGNLIARVPGSGEGWVAFFAHLDTVPHPAPIEVELVDGVFRSRGETILGADNKAAVTVLAELAARHAGSPAPVGLELVFTVAEEDGLRGAKEVDIGALRARTGFVLDHASPIGEVITAAPTYQRLQAHFEGTEAHAGIRPEDGHSAIEAAAAAIASDAARPARRGDDGQRRRDRGRDRDQRRRRLLLDRLRGALARRRESVAAC